MSGLTKLESALADRFEILDQIGEGGMGLIFRARQRSLDRIVALKVASILNEGALKRFRLEVRALSLLNHPCIVRIFDADLEGETPYFVMECIVGQSLSALLKRGPLPVDLVMSIATAVADGLAHAHTLGIVHRDIKPDNILMTDSGLVKIADFGIAKWVKPVGSMSTLISRQDLLEPSSIDAAPVTCEGIIIGSPCYLSPEQISPDEGIGPATDIYSLGITLYEALTGQVPFGGDDVPRILRRHLIEPPAPARSLDRSIPPSLDALLGRMLEKTPRNRPQHGSALAAEIAGLGLDTRSGRLAVATTDRNASTDRITRAIDPSSGDEAAQIDRRTVAVRAGDDPKCAGPAPAPRRRLVSDHEPPVPRALRPTPARPFPVAPAVRARSPAGAGFRLVLAAAALALRLEAASGAAGPGVPLPCCAG
ncbi:MAG: protein kinase [Candidatus Riflebacteria bacterium]|nr:protein kinase [Candidatus Riflebacteria bacterium]